MAKKKKDGRKDEKAAKPEAKAARAKRSKVKPKPKGMRWVNPYLCVRDVERAIGWYERAFGFKTSFSMPGPDGKIMHAEMRYKKSVVMMGPESKDGDSRAPGKDGSPVTLFCYCEDVDAIAASARAAGGTIDEEPKDQFWGDRTCFITDPEGHQWMFATHIFEMDPNAAPPSCGEAEKAGDKAKPAATGAPAKAEAAARPEALKSTATSKPSELGKPVASAPK